MVFAKKKKKTVNVCHQNIEGFFLQILILVFSLTFSQIWFTPLTIDCESTYLTKVTKEKKKKERKNPLQKM
jgi:uncharacterized membrane protein